MMHASPMHYFPMTGPFLLILFVVFAVVLMLVQLGILEYAYAKIGIQPRYVFVLLLLSLLGSYVNIPVAQIPAKQIVSNQIVSDWGVQYVVPQVEEWSQAIIAVNVGGALIPTVLSLYLLFKNRLFVQSLVGVAFVAAIVYQLAHAVPGVGIAMPPLIPPLLAAGVALVLSRQAAPALAYISGSLGTLIGADLLNLGIVQGLQAPVLSIGGAGTFDGVFLTGILAVLLA
ncbi:MAG TPA: DUF1614 domain-containing protein [Planctomycetaceae bacterium]|jgi:uncharacterized membrane protein|nr:DUF1614 domain-containing protein [Planctomycetaceae bacterium]